MSRWAAIRLLEKTHNFTFLPDHLMFLQQDPKGDVPKHHQE